MSGKSRPCLRRKTLGNVWFSSLSQEDKNCITEVFDEFEEQQAEISVKNKLLDIAEEKFKIIKAEAVKEFAERLKKRMGFCDLPNGIVRSHIDNLVKETVGDADGR